MMAAELKKKGRIMKTIRKNLLQLVVIICVLFMPKMVYAADNISGEWEYTVSSSEATVTKYDGNSLHIEIPSMIDGYPVTGIGKGVFADSNITEVIIPESIESIGSRAFADCKYLKQIEFNAKKCKAYYFRADMSSHVFVNAGKFSDSLTVIFGDTVKAIPACLFEASEDNYAHVTSVLMSDSVEIIGSFAFGNCFDLETVNWGNGIQVIEYEAFRDCSKLSSITIPEITESIEGGAFENCKYLRNIVFKALNCKVATGDTHVFVDAGKFSDSLSVVFGPDVKKVPWAIFNAPNDRYAHITSVFIPNGINEIEAYAFSNCKDLKNITIESKNTIISKYSFSNCDSNLVFKCLHNSKAEQYAKEYNFKVECLDSVNLPSIKLSSTKLTLKKGQTKYLTVWNADSIVKWKSSNKKVASVTENGLVKAKKKGKAIITAEVGGKILKCQVTII